VSVVFQDDFTGTNGSPWGAGWTTSTLVDGSVSINSNRGELWTNDASGAASRAYLSGPAALADQELLFSYQWSANTALMYLTVKLRGTGGWNNGYGPVTGVGFELRSNSAACTAQEIVAGSQTVLGTTSAFQALTTAKQWCRVRLVGSTLQARTWLDGDPEPGTWPMTYATAVTGAGQVFLSLVRAGSNSGAKSAWLDGLVLDDTVVPPPSGGSNVLAGFWRCVMGTVRAMSAVTASGTVAGCKRVGGVLVDAPGAAVVNIRDGGAAGPIVAPVRLAAAGSVPVLFGGTLSTAGDVYVEIATGPATVVVYRA